MVLNGAEDETDMIEQQRKVHDIKKFNRQLEKTLEDQKNTLQYYSQAKTKVQSKGQNMDIQEK